MDPSASRRRPVDNEPQEGPAAQRARVSADLRRRLAEGEFATGAFLPSEGRLAAEYGVSRGRIRTVLAQLARLGAVASRPKEGWQVVGGHRVQGMDRLLSFAQWAELGGRAPGGRIVSRERRPADAQEATVLGVRLGEPVQRFERVRTLDGRTVMVERSAWAPWLNDVVDAMPTDLVSTTEFLASEGVVVSSGEHRIEAVAASTQDAALLGVRRTSPLLQVARRTMTAGGRVVEVATDRYLADVIAFHVDAGESIRVLA
jgi:GntR family transcriptional regulator